jgi:hypothetical protein
MWSALASIFCSAHVGTGSETTVEQESQQVRASGIDSQKCCVDHDTLFDYPTGEEVSEVPGRMSIDLDGMDDIIISEIYHAQSEENASLHWLAQKQIQTTT